MSVERKIENLLEQLRQLGPMHKGSLATRFQRCYKPTCWCADRSKQGHGPVHVLTWKEKQVTQAKTIREEELEPTRQLIANQRSFERLVTELTHLKTLSLSEEKKTAKSSSSRKRRAK